MTDVPKSVSERVPEEWTETEPDGSGTVGEHYASITDIPEGAKRIAGWHQKKSEGVSIFTKDGTYWVDYSAGGRVAWVEEFTSDTAAYDHAIKTMEEHVF